MPRIAQVVVLLPFLSFFLLLFECKREAPPTIISGKVSNKKTGSPISGATVDIGFLYKNNNGEEYVDEKSYITDQQGQFHLAQESDYEDISFSFVYKVGYVTHPYLNIIRETTNDLDIKLVPKDGTLRLQVSNLTGQYDSIYVVILSPSIVSESQGLGAEIKTKKYPITNPLGGTYSENFDLPSGEFTLLFWGPTNLFPNLSSAMFRDSTFISTSDTSDYIISY